MLLERIDQLGSKELGHQLYSPWFAAHRTIAAKKCLSVYFTSPFMACSSFVRTKADPALDGRKNKR